LSGTYKSLTIQIGLSVSVIDDNYKQKNQLCSTNYSWDTRGRGEGYKGLLMAHRRRCPYLIHTVVLKILPLGVRKSFKNRVPAIGRGEGGKTVFGADSAFTEKVIEY
jgi:hypothetical protein